MPLKLGAVFVNFRRPDLLLAALNSLETRHRLKLCLVDNAAGELSLAAAWNRGIESAISWGADWILVANDDILFHPCTVDHLVERAVDRAYGFLCPVDVKKEFGLGPADLSALATPTDGEDRQAADYACFLLSPDLFHAVGPFDENFRPAYFEDSDYNLRLGLAGTPAMLTTYAPFFHHCGGGGGISAAAAARNRQYFVTKWKPVVPWAENFV